MGYVLAALVVVVFLLSLHALGIRPRRKPTDQQIIEAREREIINRRLAAVNDWYAKHPEQKRTGA